jgi:hypothetical protein
MLRHGGPELAMPLPSDSSDGSCIDNPDSAVAGSGPNSSISMSLVGVLVVSILEGGREGISTSVTGAVLVAALETEV